jgi:hypothetical protein
MGFLAGAVGYIWLLRSVWHQSQQNPERRLQGRLKTGLHRPRLSAIIMSSPLPALILIGAPFSSRLSPQPLGPVHCETPMISNGALF